MSDTQVYIDKDGLALYNQLTKGDTTPLPDGAQGSTGTSKKYARADHIHPSDSSKVDKVQGKGLSTNDYTDEEKAKLDNKVDKVSGKGLSTEDYTTADKTKLGNIAAGAEVNVQADWNESDTSSDAFIANKPSIPSQASDVGAIAAIEKGAANGVATLDGNGIIPSTQLPSFVDDVIESYPVTGAEELSAGWLSKTSGGTAFTPEKGKIYILMADSASYATNTQFRWGGTAYVKMLDGGIRPITSAEIAAIVNS